ncbi:MAG: efflux RND transporter permease subunit [Microgenomates group bacterium]
MIKKRASYLSSLRFDPKLLQSFQAKYLANIRLPGLLIITIVIIGISGLITIPRRLNPEIKIPIVSVSTLLPGANPEDIESLVTVPLERELKSVKGLDTMSSTSRESLSSVVLQFQSSVKVDEAVADVQNLVDRVTNLPDDAKAPNVRSVDFEDQPFWIFAITSKSDTASLMRFGESLKDKIENIPQVDRVVTTGLDDQTIEVTVNLQKSKDYNITPLSLLGLVQTASKSFPAGSVNSDNSTFSLTIDREIVTIEDLRKLPILIDDRTVRLGDIATIAERSKSGQQHTYIANLKKGSERTIQFFVYKKTNADIDKSFKVTEPVVNTELKNYKGQFSLYTVRNTANDITKQFNDLFDEFKTTILLVFVLLLLFLGLRQAIISTITVPLTFLASFAIINAFGLTLNFLTMFSFLLSLGLLIDDTIVSVAAMTRYYKTGRFTPFETGVMVWKDFIVPLWSTTITTIWAFVPLLLATGIIGEFIKSIPIVVTTTMLSSTTIAVLITIPMMIVFLKPQLPKRVVTFLKILAVVSYVLICAFLIPKNNLFPFALVSALIGLLVVYKVRIALADRYRRTLAKHKFVQSVIRKVEHVSDNGVVNVQYLSEGYRTLIERILSSKSARTKTLIAISVFALLAYLLIPLGFVKNEFFPKDNEEIVYVGVDYPAGTSATIINQEGLSLANKLRSTKELDYLLTEMGQIIQPDGDRGVETDAILYTLHLTKKEDRKITSAEIAQTVRDDLNQYSKGKVSVVEISGGPPAGADVQIKLLGEDLGVLDTYADKIVSYLKKQSGLINIDKSIKSGTSKIVFTPDNEKLADVGLTKDQVGLWLRTYASGFTLDTVLFGKKEKDIIFRTNSYDGMSISELGTIEIPLKEGGTVPLISLGDFSLASNPTSITRESEKRTISVFASVKPGVNIPEKNAELLKFAESLNMPDGYSLATGGVNEENQKSVTSILQAMVLSFMLILITMVIEFGSFRQAFMSMLIIPISIAGVFYIFALTRTPLSFAALIGILALFGIVVTHAIVVIEKINENRAHGLSLHDAIADAAANRLEPVLLTSLATILGLIPITIADPFWRGLGGAIISGLIFSGALKLFFIPVMYYNFYRSEEKAK